MGTASTAIGFAQFAAAPGCVGEPCIQPVPCNQCIGTWSDQFNGSWSITSNNSGTVTGTLVVNNASPCPKVSYTVTGTLTQNQGTSFYNGSSPISLHAASPSPSSGGQGCVIATYANLTGVIENVGCDIVGPSQAVLSTDIIASTNTNFVKSNDRPTGESTNFEGWSSQYPAVAQWKGTLSGGVSYNGRQVTEEPGTGTTHDGCYFPGSIYPPAALSGGIWNVGYYLPSAWDDDYVGFSTSAVTYYRQNFRAPCSATISQAMAIYYDGQSLNTEIYVQGVLMLGIPSNSQVSSSRDGYTVVKTWP